MSRFSTARDDTETPTPSPAQQKLDAQNQIEWTRWSGEVNEKLAELSSFADGLTRDGGTLSVLTALTLDGAHDEAAKSMKKMSDALNARVEAEVAVLRDDFVEKIDASVIAAAPKKLKAISDDIAAVRVLVKGQAKATSDLLDKQAERIDRVDAKRRSDRNVWHKEKLEVSEKLTAVLGDMLDKHEKKLERLAAEVRSLRTILVEAEIVAPELSLPFDDRPGR
jgi:hypothetical protein